MHFKLTKKEVKNCGKQIFAMPSEWISVIQDIATELGYSTCRYGWACDYYLVGDYIFCYGTAPIGSVVYAHHLKDVLVDMKKRIKEEKEATQYQLSNEFKSEMCHLLIEEILKSLEIDKKKD